MQKTKLGISVGLLGAALYFIGIAGILPVAILAVYVLLMEQNEWLRKTALKAAAIVIFFSVLTAAVGLAGTLYSALYEIFALFKVSFSLSWFNRILSICQNVIHFMQVFILIICGFKAFNQGSLKINIVDSVINKHN